MLPEILPVCNDDKAGEFDMDDIRHQTTLQMASLIDIDDEDGIDII